MSENKGIWTPPTRFKNVEKHLMSVVLILAQHEVFLSDGYGYYCSGYAEDLDSDRHNGDLIVTTLEDIARKIVDKLDGHD